jgi:hypothetical protein
MSDDALQTLLSQFSYFIAEQNFDHQDWERITTEQGAVDTARKIDRFFRSWKWGDEDRAHNTLRFLKVLCNRGDEDTALAIMCQAYDLVGGADAEDLEDYPMLQALEDEQIPHADSVPLFTHTAESFIDIENTTDDFYDDLIENINKCYRIGVYDGTFVLTRKLLENLVIDLLRKEYPKSYLRMYYIPEYGRFRNFSELLEVFEYRLKDYQSYSNGMNTELISDINRFRESANSDAHSIVRNPEQEEIKDLGEDAEHAAKVMFRALRNMD